MPARNQKFQTGCYKIFLRNLQGLCYWENLRTIVQSDGENCVLLSCACCGKKNCFLCFCLRKGELLSNMRNREQGFNIIVKENCILTPCDKLFRERASTFCSLPNKITCIYMFQPTGSMTTSLLNVLVVVGTIFEQPCSIDELPLCSAQFCRERSAVTKVCQHFCTHRPTIRTGQKL